MVRKIVLIMLLLACLSLGTTSQAVESCPDGQVRYDVVEKAFVYGGTCQANNYCVFVESDEDWTWWSSQAGCYTTRVCVSTEDGLIELGAIGYGSYPSSGTYDITWWGGCQVPSLPYETYLPLVMGGR